MFHFFLDWRELAGGLFVPDELPLSLAELSVKSDHLGSGENLVTGAEGAEALLLEKFSGAISAGTRFSLAACRLRESPASTPSFESAADTRIAASWAEAGLARVPGVLPAAG